MEVGPRGRKDGPFDGSRGLQGEPGLKSGLPEGAGGGAWRVVGVEDVWTGWGFEGEGPGTAPVWIARSGVPGGGGGRGAAGEQELCQVLRRKRPELQVTSLTVPRL